MLVGYRELWVGLIEYIRVEWVFGAEAYGDLVCAILI